MKYMTTNEIRETWLKFWKSKGHYEIESKSLIPDNDNSLLFINSGVATLKNYLSGKEIPPNNRIVNSQKSLRTNDIENVGVTSRHHTMFEMLGNFSIGDYFKKEAIEYAFELITSPEYYDLDLEKIYITVHPDDENSYEIWKKLGIKADKIIKTEENFWEIGKGPGGPNTEIFYDRGEEYDKREPAYLLQEDLETDRVIEIWNIVFSQYNCNPEIPRKQYQELPQKNIDTGMGLERMACIIQDVPTNFETDNFQIISQEIEKLTKTKYQNHQKTYRIIIDHIRALVFAISDGVIPTNEGRGYVIRRILRRAVKYSYLDLNIKKPLLYKLVDAVIKQMQEYYPYLKEKSEITKEIIQKEEERFLHTINDGFTYLNKYLKELKEQETLAGEKAFKLYDTYGFPLELTLELTKEKNLKVDEEGFYREMENQRIRAQQARKNIGSIDTQNNFLKQIKVESQFVGYDQLETTTKISFITDLKEEKKEAEVSEIVYIILDQTPFYATSGGQKCDLGQNEFFKVINVEKLPSGQHLHEVEVIKKITKDQNIAISIDKERRNKITKNHSATHLLHQALNEVLGDNVNQAGSLQDQNKTRFDYTYHTNVEEKELEEISKIVNQNIHNNFEVIIKYMSLEEAKKKGAKALFENKYGNEVRVVQMGESIELCGGTHVQNTQEIQNFLIISESSVGSGVRRIEALTGTNINHYIEEKEEKIQKLIFEQNELIKNKQIIKNEEIIKIFNELTTINKTISIINLSKYEEKIKELDKKNQELIENHKENKNLEIKDIIEELKTKIKIKDDINWLEEEIYSPLDTKDIKNIADKLDQIIPNLVGIFKVIQNKKITIIVKVNKNLTNKYHAGNIVKEKLIPYNGKGGGKADLAQGGGTFN